MRRASPASWLLALSAALLLAPANAAEHPGDSLAAAELHRSVDSADTLQQRFLMLIQSSPRSERFDLYRVYDESVGTWLPIRVLRSMLQPAPATRSASREPRLRDDLRDYARYALSEIDRNASQPGVAIAGARGREVVRFVQASRRLLAKTRPTVVRLADVY